MNFYDKRGGVNILVSGPSSKISVWNSYLSPSRQTETEDELWERKQVAGQVALRTKGHREGWVQGTVWGAGCGWCCEEAPRTLDIRKKQQRWLKTGDFKTKRRSGHPHGQWVRPQWKPALLVQFGPGGHCCPWRPKQDWGGQFTDAWPHTSLGPGKEEMAHLHQDSGRKLQ